jgi:hypothetical protein
VLLTHTDERASFKGNHEMSQRNEGVVTDNGEYREQRQCGRECIESATPPLPLAPTQR